MLAYTYLIGWSAQNKFYYGVRYANGCDTSELWKTYFTSSKYVAEFRNKYNEPDIIQIRRVFSDKEKAKMWEHKVLRRMDVVKRFDFLNRSINLAAFPPNGVGAQNSFYGRKHTSETKKKISQTKRSDKIKCEKCGKETNVGNHNRWHGERCGIHQTSGTKKMLKADGQIFTSLGAAAECFGVSNATITYRIKSPNFDYNLIGGNS